MIRFVASFPGHHFLAAGDSPKDPLRRCCLIRRRAMQLSKAICMLDAVLDGKRRPSTKATLAVGSTMDLGAHARQLAHHLPAPRGHRAITACRRASAPADTRFRLTTGPGHLHSDAYLAFLYLACLPAACQSSAARARFPASKESSARHVVVNYGPSRWWLFPAPTGEHGRYVCGRVSVCWSR